MNKTDIVETIQKRTTQLTVLSVTLVGTMMTIFLLPALFEDANAVIIGQAFAPPDTFFSNILGNMGSGKFTQFPTTILDGTIMLWKTDSKGLFGGLEQGTVFANVRQKSGEIVGPVSFSFSNPITGSNSCHGAPDRGPLLVTCHIPSSGTSVTATYIVSLSNQDSSAQCEILSKFSGLDQTKIIAEKLPLLKCK